MTASDTAAARRGEPAGADGPQLRERVRAHYAQAARAVTTTTSPTEVQVSDRGASCCGPATGRATAGTEAGSCCAEDDGCGARFYSAGEQALLPETALIA